MDELAVVVAKGLGVVLLTFTVGLVAEAIGEAFIREPLGAWLGRRRWVQRLGRTERPWWLVATWVLVVGAAAWALATDFESPVTFGVVVAGPIVAIALSVWWAEHEK